MILTQIGVAARIKFHALQPAHVNRVRGNLHADGIHTRVRHFTQRPEKIDGFRRCKFAFHIRRADHVARCADQSHLVPGLLQNGLHQIARRCLALGTRNAI